MAKSGMKPKTGRTTKVISIRVPIPLYDRINILSQKNCTTKNHWSLHALIAEAYKHDKDKRYQLLNKSI